MRVANLGINTGFQYRQNGVYDKLSVPTRYGQTEGSKSKMEQTFIAAKPDAVQRGLIGDIISRFEKKGFQLVGLKLMQVPKELAEKHYGEHSAKPFFKGLVDFITSGPIVAMVWQGDNVVASARQMMGATNPKDAAPGTIRGDFSVDLGRNVIHGSDSPESAQREIGLFFGKDELVSNWSRSTEGWVYENPKKPAGVA